MTRCRAMMSLSLLLLVAACGGEPSPMGPVLIEADMMGVAPDMQETPDATPDMEPPPPPGPMLDVPERAWTWVEVEGMSCADGSQTGVGINYNPASSDIVFFLAGGGACWNQLTCYQFSTAVNITGGYDETKFNGSIGYLNTIPLFNRGLEDNPMKDATYVAVPYCTGDVHGGTKATSHGGQPTQHVGYNNFTAVLDTFASEFQGASRVVMTGSSAGAYGASLNLFQTRERFPNARVDLINDGGPPMINTSLEGQWRAAWGLDANVPEGCAACATDLRAYLSFAISSDPTARVALLSYQEDGVISQFYGLDAATFAQQLGDLTSEVFDANTNAHVFLVPGTSHTMWSNMASVTQSGTNAWDWVKAMLSDDANWSSITP